MQAAIHSNPLWRYRDARDIEHVGHTEGCFDHGGADTGLFIRDCVTGEFSVVSGSRYKTAERIWETCSHHDAVVTA